MDAVKVICMADLFSPEAFYTSAHDFAHRALEAHNAGDYRCVPLFAGTAIEHLAKACLAQRSPALLAEMRRDSNIRSLIALLRLEGAEGPATIRTVGLREALNRLGEFFKPKADKDDLDTLVAMRDGVVHAADDTKVEERILTAFVQQADALLADLGREREDFWTGQLYVVDELLAGASNKLKLRVEMRLADAGAMQNRLYEIYGDAGLRALRAHSKATVLERDQRPRDCPVCGSEGIATGEHTVEVVLDEPQLSPGHDAHQEVWFTAQEYECQVCRLELYSEEEIDAAGMDTAWEIEDADPHKYEQLPDDPPDDGDAAYERWRDER